MLLPELLIPTLALPGPSNPLRVTNQDYAMKHPCFTRVGSQTQAK